jgi:PPOX class probable F420-dependent enzyme
LTHHCGHFFSNSSTDIDEITIVRSTPVCLDLAMIIPDEYADIFAKRAFWHVATTGPDGAPQSSPVWATYEGGYIKFSLTRGRQKYHNLEADPGIALSAIDPDNPYRYLEVRGRVVSVEDDPENDFINRMSAKYMDVDPYPGSQPGDGRVVMVIEPEHSSSMG